MKQTYNINLAGMQFVIDDDAYALLRDYLDTLSHLYRNTSDADEILQDVEIRIAELFTAQMASPATIITLQMAQAVISRIGKPEDIAEVEISQQPTPSGYSEEIDVESGSGAVPPPLPGSEPPVEKRLFRNPSDKLIGGVCSGVAKYLGIDPTWVRLAAVLLFFLSYSTAAIVYIILWIVLPVADTPYKQMQMEGKSATFDNIGNTVNRMFSGKDSSGEPRRGGSLAIFMNVVMIIVGIICFPIVFALAMVILGLVIGLVAFLFGLPTIISDTVLSTPGGEWLAVAITGGCIALLIPLISMIYMIFRGEKKTITKSGRISLLVIWIIGLLALITGGLATAHNGVMYNLRHNPVIRVITDTDDDDDDDIETVNEIPAHTAAIVDAALDRVDSAMERVDAALDTVVARHGEPSRPAGR